MFTQFGAISTDCQAHWLRHKPTSRDGNLFKTPNFIMGIKRSVIIAETRISTWYDDYM